MKCLLANFSLCVILGMVLLFCGCWKGSSRVHSPGINASAAGERAMAQYDTNGDGVVKGEELEKAPSLKAALQNLDNNSDGGVSAEEVTARVEAWQASRLGLISLGCTVRQNGQPISGATVTFEPEEFLGDEIQAAVGTTNGQGKAALQIPGRELSGLACGLYLVKISKKQGGQETIPPIYNRQTIFGEEVARDAPGFNGGFHFDLTQ